MEKVDVAIVGAGPGGTTCALRLAEAGLKVRLLDKATFPRDKICGDALSGKVLSVLKYTHGQAHEAMLSFAEKEPSYGVRFVAPNGIPVDVPFRPRRDNGEPKPPGYLSKRVAFDQFLLDQVKQHTDTIISEGFHVKHIERNAEGYRVSDGEEYLQARLLIGADGAQSIVKRKAMPAKVNRKHVCAGLRQYVRGVGDFQTGNFIELHFFKRLKPGYFWLFALPNGWVNVGLGMRADVIASKRISLRKLYQELLATEPTLKNRLQVAEPMEPIQGWSLPMGSRRWKLSQDHLMLVGDAGALIDPFTGEGIGNAMLSGKIAAEIAVEAIKEQDFSANRLREYDEKVYQKIGQELQISTYLQQLSAQPWLFNFVARKATRNPALQQVLSNMFDNLDLRQQLSRPSFYWKLLSGTT